MAALGQVGEKWEKAFMVMKGFVPPPSVSSPSPLEESSMAGKLCACRSSTMQGLSLGASPTAEPTAAIKPLLQRRWRASIEYTCVFI